MVALVVALLSAAMAVVLGASPSPSSSAEASASASAALPVHDGLAAEQALASAFTERREQVRVVQAEASRAAVAARPTVVWPAAGAITGVYGERRGRSRHPGLDLDGTTGDAVWAAARGVVSWAGPAPAGYSGYGTLVIVDHGEGVQTLYAHLSALSVATGERVEAGDRVGAIGTTGHVTGSHLHFEVRRNGVMVDPVAWLPAR